jgi:hypothetical protein
MPSIDDRVTRMLNRWPTVGMAVFGRTPGEGVTALRLELMPMTLAKRSFNPRPLVQASLAAGAAGLALRRLRRIH